MTPNLRATLTLVVPRAPRFVVTPKGRTGDARGRVHAPPPLTAILGLSFIAAAVYALALLNVLPITYRSAWAAVGAFGWLVINAGLGVARDPPRALAAVRRRTTCRGALRGRRAGLGRRDERGRPGRVGRRRAARHPRAAVARERHLVSFELAAGIVSLWASVRSMRRAASGELHYAFEFDPDQDVAAADLTRAIFQGEYPVAGVEPVSMPEVLRTDLVELSRRARRRGLVRPAAPRGTSPVLRSGGA